MVDQQINNYKIISLLGEGGMASVYLAEHHSLGNKVAIKMLKPEYVQHPNIRKRFLAEARNLAQMNHPNVIKVTDLIDAGDIVAFVMEYIDGQTLEKYIEDQGKLSDTLIELFFDQMIASLEYIHSQGFIHRDIKPSNFMITKTNEIKLLDFGIAKNTNEGALDYTKTGLMQQMGTPLYMSPEQIKNTSEITKETDYYSLGVVLWEMVMAKKPYDSNVLTLPEIQVAIMKEPLSITNSIWDNLIKSLTVKSKENRNVRKHLHNISERKIAQNEYVIISKKEKRVFSRKWLVIFGVILFFLIAVPIISKSDSKLEKIELAEKSKVNSNKSSADKVKENPVYKKQDKSDKKITTKDDVPIPEKEGKQEKDNDNDGILDIDDDCPRTYGPKENKGCPYIEFEKPKPTKNRTYYIYNQNKSSAYGNTSIDKIEVTDNYTIIYFTDQLKYANSTWVSIDPKTYILDKGNNTYKDLLYVSGIEISPSKTYAKKDNEIIKFKLYFPRISDNCNAIDFIESYSSEWKFYGIKLEN